MVKHIDGVLSQLALCVGFVGGSLADVNGLLLDESVDGARFVEADEALGGGVGNLHIPDVCDDRVRVGSGDNRAHVVFDVVLGERSPLGVVMTGCVPFKLHSGNAVVVCRVRPSYRKVLQFKVLLDAVEKSFVGRVGLGV